MQNDSGEICLKSHISKYGKGYFAWALQCISLFDVSFKGKVTDIDVSSYLLLGFLYYC